MTTDPDKAEEGKRPVGLARSQKMIAAMVDQIEQLLPNTLDDALKQKLQSALSKLQGLLQSHTISHEALAAALTEAVAVISAASVENAKLTAQQKVELMWEQVKKYNDAIDDGFGNMRKAGIQFNEQLWARHQSLSGDLKDDPYNIAKQKELDKVDDALLHEAEPQLSSHPDARKFFNDVKKESEQRRKVVDQDLEQTTKSLAAVKANTDMDWQQSATEQGKDVTLNDVESQNVGASTNSQQKFVRKQTNLYFRTKLHKWWRFFQFLKIPKP